MASPVDINHLLDDKLFQVIGSTPASIAESLRKVELRGKAQEGGLIFAVCVFAAAVNKATLETFLAEPRFSNIRPIIGAALSISGRSNMTALTLFGHCLLTTDLASEINFTSEFRKKMGQKHLWAGDLDSGSLSDKQKTILKEKKRVTNPDDAKALGGGFLKFVGLDRDAMNAREAAYFPSSGSRVAAQPAPSRSAGQSLATAPVLPSRTYAPPVQDAPTQSSRPSAGATNSPPTPRAEESRTATVEDSFENIPSDVMDYRRNILGQSDADIRESLGRRGMNAFVANTRTAMSRDPTGERTLRASAVGRTPQEDTQ